MIARPRSYIHSRPETEPATVRHTSTRSRSWGRRGSRHDGRAQRASSTRASPTITGASSTSLGRRFDTSWPRAIPARKG